MAATLANSFQLPPLALVLGVVALGLCGLRHEKNGGQQMTSQPKRLRQLELIGAILLEVDRQGFRTISVEDLDAIREAADTIVAAVGQRDGAKTVDNPQSIG
jgi:hypothetical protein